MWVWEGGESCGWVHMKHEIEAGSRFKQRWEKMSYHANLPDPLAPLPGLQSTPDLIAVRKGNSCDNTTQLIG